MTVASQRSYYLDRPSPSGLVDVIDLILDKGLVIDVYARISLVGIELITIDARIVVASVDTYLRFAEAVNRLDLARTEDSEGLPQLIGDLQEGGARHKTKGALEGAEQTVKNAFGRHHGDDDDEDEGAEEELEEERPRRRSRSTSSRRERER